MTDQDPTQVTPPQLPPAPPAAVPAADPGSPSAPPAPPVPPAAWYATPEVPAPLGAIESTPPPDPVPTQPVVPAGAAGVPRPGRSRVRWIVAALVALLVIGGATGAAFLLTGSPAGSTLAAWAPADTVSYGELRVDMPGGQQAELAKFMAGFPGFADQAAFPAKLGEIADRLVGAATESKHSYTKEIQPWLAGEIAVAQGPMAAPAGTDLQSLVADQRILLMVATKDATAARTWLDGVIAEQKLTTSTRDHNGVTITVVAMDGASDLGINLPETGYAFSGTTLLLGDLASITASLDTKGATGLDASATYQAARKALPGAFLGFSYMDTAASFASTFDSLGAMTGDAKMGSAIAKIYGQMLPPWTALAVYAKDGRLVMETASPHVDAMPPSANVADKVAAMAPADTVAMFSGHDVGARILAIHAMAAAEPDLKEGLAQVDQALGVVGGFEAATGWMGDLGVVITKQGDAVDGGLVVTTADAAAAKRLFTSLRAMITLGAQGMLTFEEETYKGTTLVVVDLSQLSGLAGSMTGTEAPADLKLAYALVDDAVVIGIGPQFVKDVLDARADGATSLAAQPRYSSLIAAAGGKENAGVLWLDVTAVRGMIEPLLPSDVSATYEKEIQPYLVPLDAVGGVTIVSKDLDRSRILLTSTTK